MCDFVLHALIIQSMHLRKTKITYIYVWTSKTYGNEKKLRKWEILYINNFPNDYKYLAGTTAATKTRRRQRRDASVCLLMLTPGGHTATYHTHLRASHARKLIKTLFPVTYCQSAQSCTRFSSNNDDLVHLLCALRKHIIMYSYRRARDFLTHFSLHTETCQMCEISRKNRNSGKTTIFEFLVTVRISMTSIRMCWLIGSLQIFK